MKYDTWVKMNKQGYYNCYRLQCPRCHHVFIMPRHWGIWKGCPTCWIELKPPEGGETE